MVRMMVFLAAGNRACGMRRSHCSAGGRARARGCRSRAGTRARSEGADRHLSASTRPAWTPRFSPATISIAFANGTWVEEHADPGRQVELRHVHRARRLVAATRTATLIEEAAKRSEQPDRRGLREFHRRSGDRSEGPRAVPAVAVDKMRAVEVEGRASPNSMPRPTGWASARRSAALSARTTRLLTQYILHDVPGRSRHARPRLLSVERRPSSPRLRANYLKHLTNVLTLAGEPNAAARAKAIVDFETRIAKVQLDQDREPRRDQDL